MLGADQIPGYRERIGGQRCLLFRCLNPLIAAAVGADTACLPQVLEVGNHRDVQPAGAASNPARNGLGNFKAREKVPRKGADVALA